MPLQSNSFVADLMTWYLHNKRELPWRQTNDPYKIWLSEIILQQTRVNQGLPYYLRFVEKYPTIQALANANEEEVLRLWQGLGYYSRARNLHQCAKFVSTNLKGKFPETFSELMKLKGVGPYTAAAIASIAFGEAVPTIDGNVYRVLSRILGIDLNIADQKSRKVFFNKAKELMADNEPGFFNQAIMEYGALFCLPKKPKCEQCTISKSCHAYEFNQQDSLPVNNRKIKISNRHFNYVVFCTEDKILVNKRNPGDIWESLYDFYNVESDRFLSEEELMFELPTQFNNKCTVISVSKDYKHILTHQRINARFYIIEINDRNFAKTVGKKLGLQLISQQSLERVPKPRLIEGFLADEKFT